MDVCELGEGECLQLELVRAVDLGQRALVARRRGGGPARREDGPPKLQLDLCPFASGSHILQLVFQELSCVLRVARRVRVACAVEPPLVQCVPAMWRSQVGGELCEPDPGVGRAARDSAGRGRLDEGRDRGVRPVGCLRELACTFLRLRDDLCEPLVHCLALSLRRIVVDARRKERVCEARRFAVELEHS